MKFKEEGPEFTVLSIVEYRGSGGVPENEALHLRLMKDGSLRIRESNPDGSWKKSVEMLRHLVWRKESGGASASADRGTNQAVAYLDGLKKCAPGQFHFSYPGLGDSRNTILGREDERCRVKIVHSNMHMECSFTDETIALLTSAKKYENARKGVLEGSIDSEESARMNKECRIQ